jgi:hypothetical protein
MKFTLPLENSRAFFHEWSSLQGTWEYRFATISVLVQFLISGIILAWFWRMLPPKVPLWYSKPWGEERLASPFFLLLPPLTSIIVYGINRTLLTRSAADHPMFARVLSLTSVLVSFLSTVIVIRIVTLVS